jgi:hypothetical protein
MRCRSIERVEGFELVFARWLQEILAGDHFDATRSAAASAAREFDRGMARIADIDERFERLGFGLGDDVSVGGSEFDADHGVSCGVKCLQQLSRVFQLVCSTVGT